MNQSGYDFISSGDVKDRFAKALIAKINFFLKSSSLTHENVRQVKLIIEYGF